MGKPMCKNLIKAGYSLVVMDRSESAVAEVVVCGAQSAPTPKAVAELTDIFITMLPNSPQVKEVILGENGIIEGARKGSIVIDMSSIALLVSREVAGKLAEKGIDMLDVR
jgi:2-hydroxy-3-oxopropionate reductase